MVGKLVLHAPIRQAGVVFFVAVEFLERIKYYIMP
jgi:hypothetical protein